MTLSGRCHGAPDRKPVTQLFVILVPADGDPDEHLRLLANVAELYSCPIFRERMAKAPDMRAIRKAFEESAEAIGRSTNSVSAPASASARRSRTR